MYTGVYEIDPKYVVFQPHARFEAKVKLLKDITECKKAPPELHEWVEQHITRQRPSWSDSEVFEWLQGAHHPLTLLRNILNHKSIPFTIWKRIVVLYLAQFLVKIHGSGKTPIMIACKKKTDVGYEIRTFTRQVLKHELQWCRKFAMMSEDEYMSDLKAADDKAHEAVGDLLSRDKGKRKRSSEDEGGAPPEKKINLGLRGIKRQVDVIKYASSVQPEEEKPQPGKAERIRITLYASDVFCDDVQYAPKYDKLCFKPLCNMITCKGLFVDPNNISPEGHELIAAHFRKHGASYTYPDRKEFNVWSPFVIQAGDLLITQYTGGKLGSTAWNNGLRRNIRSIDIIINHLFSVLCGKNEYNFLTLMDFMAAAVQRPWQNCNIMINHQGPQGIGKTKVSIKKVGNAADDSKTPSSDL